MVAGNPSAGRSVEALSLPEGSRLISVMRGGRAEIAVGATVLEAGDQVLAILESGKEDELRRVFNLGIGYCAVVPPGDVGAGRVIGRIVPA